MFLILFEPYNCFGNKLDRIYYSYLTCEEKEVQELGCSWVYIARDLSQDPAS